MIVFIKAFAIFKSSIVLATVKKTLLIWNCSYPLKLKWRAASVQIKKQKRKIPDFGGRLSNCWRAPQACGRKGVSPCTLSLGHHCIPIQCTGTGMYFHLSIKCLKTGIEHFLPISSLVHALHSDLLHQAVFFLMLFPC